VFSYIVADAETQWLARLPTLRRRPGAAGQSGGFLTRAWASMRQKKMAFKPR